MKLWKKVVLGFLSVLLVVVAGVCAYGIKMYSDANSTINGIYQSVNRKSNKGATANIDAQEPFSVLLMGIDTGDLGRTEQGRSDTTMVVTINPKENKSTMISLDRDILTDIVGNDTQDKLNHAYAFGGAEMAINTVQELLDIPIHHYVSINMKGLKDLIDAVGGIEVDNTIGEFTLDGITVPAGKIKLDGTTGLAYARMRHEDPEGDVGRQRRQREVVEKIVRKVMSFDGVSKYRKILDAVEANVKTDLTWDDMMDIQSKYLSAFKTIDSEQLQGYSATIDDIYYQVLDPNSLYKTQTTLRKQLGLKEHTSEREKDLAFYNQFSYAVTDTALIGESGDSSANSSTSSSSTADTTTGQTEYNGNTQQAAEGTYDPNTYVDPNAYTDPNAYADPNTYVDPNAPQY
ncbi:LCP family protein [Enterococcus faecalis]|uniref:LCP family glycopolymer transferase n=1 Tax=Enterococcus faecalis TaxID=1351 RepID=UPI003D6A620A